MDGAVHAAIWTIGPMLLPSLTFISDSWHDTGGKIKMPRPLSAEEALVLTMSMSTQNISNSTTSKLLQEAVHAGFNSRSDQQRSRAEYESIQAFAGTTHDMVYLLLICLMGRALGCHLMDRRRLKQRYGRIYSRLSLLARSLPCSRYVRSVPPWRIACVVVAFLSSLLMLNWGLGMYTIGGYMTVRFATEFICGHITWGDESFRVAAGHEKEKDEFGNEQQQLLMEEGQALLSRSISGEQDELIEPSSPSTQKLFDKKWLNTYWLMGVASSAFVGGFLFYPFNRFMAAFDGNTRIYVFIMFIGVGWIVDRCLFRYYSTISVPYNSERLSFSDARIVSGGGDRSRDISRSSSASTTVQRRKKPQHQQQKHQSTSFDEEQQITFFDQSLDNTPQLDRSNSHDTLESEQFFDCLDDIELDSEHNMEYAIPMQQSTASTQHYDNQIATYSKRRVVYPDGKIAVIPTGESLSNTPPGYLALYKNKSSKAQSKYKETQAWRQQEKIYSIHARPHTYFAQIKVAYPHVIHGFTSNGMPVVYEKPGQMKLKELFRSGMNVEDMLVHYSYLMEYLSNMESILTELHANDCGSIMSDDAWQDELAAYAHAKQQRLQSDPISFRFCVVMDISGATPKSISGDVMTYLKRAGDVNTLHYPGSMRQAVAVQAPFWIGVAWKAIKGVMPASVTVDLLSSAQTMEGGLMQYIDEDQIPVEYGVSQQYSIQSILQTCQLILSANSFLQGKSKFKLGEHPFEVGLKQLVERQGEELDDLDSGYEDNTQSTALLHESTTLHLPPPSPQPERCVNYLKNDDSLASSTKLSNTMTREWDGLGSGSVLTVTAILQFFVYFVIGSIELALPYWLISPLKHGGLGYEPRGNSMAVLVSSLIIAWAIKRSRFNDLVRSAIDKSPLRGFRIGIGSSSFFFMCIGLIPITSDTNESTMGLLCFSAYLSLLFMSTTMGIVSLEQLRTLVIISEEGSATFGWLQNTNLIFSTLGRATGIVFIAPIFRWSVKGGLSFPLNASFFLCIMACVCWLLYIISFSLHIAAPSLPTTTHMKRKQSQFLSAMSGWISFMKEVIVVACADVSWLAKILSTGRARK